jgi:magnesium transporter
VPKYLTYLDGKTVERDRWPGHNTVVWVDLGPGEQEQLDQVVSRLYHPHPVAMEKVLHGHERPAALLIEEDAVVCVISDPQGHIDNETRYPIGIFLGHHFLITTHFYHDNDLIDTSWRRTIQNNGLQHGVDFVLYHLLYTHLRHVYRATEQIGQSFETLHIKLLRTPNQNLSLDIVRLRKKTYWLYSVIRPEIKIFALLKEHVSYVQKNNHPYFEDLYSQVDEILNDIEAYRDGLEGMVEAFSGMQSNQINKVMKFLTILSILALPATTIASIYGMNFWIPEIHWHYGYWYSLIIMILVTAALLLYMRLHGWFR